MTSISLRPIRAGSLQLFPRLAIAFYLVLTPPWHLFAQESDQTSKSAEASKADQATAEGATGEKEAAGEAVTEFSGVFAQWKQILTAMRELQARYSLAEPAEQEGIRQEWEATIAKGQALMPRLQETAISAYAVDPKADADLQKLLLEILADQIRHDDYFAAKEVGLAMAEAGDTDPRLMNLVGIAAFATNDFVTAEKFLTEADRQGSLTEQGEKFFATVKENVGLWEKEQELRKAEAEADDLPRVKLETSAGDVVLELFENEAPETVGNFISLVEKGFYDGLSFHRVLPAFMAQGGCPNGDGSGGPGYTIYCECINENHRNHFAGSLSMAKELARHTGGSQFFITFVPTTHLNGKHTVFGRVVEGMEVLPQIVRVDPDDPARTSDVSVIERATVLRKRDHTYEPNKVK